MNEIKGATYLLYRFDEAIAQAVGLVFDGIGVRLSIGHQESVIERVVASARSKGSLGGWDRALVGVLPAQAQTRVAVMLARKG